VQFSRSVPTQSPPCDGGSYRAINDRGSRCGKPINAIPVK
jgi:hypothetical protein